MATGDLSYPFDVKFTMDGEDPIGFMLSVPQEQTKSLIMQESDPPRFDRDLDEFSEIFRTSNPRNDTPFVCNDFSGGVGQLHYDEGDPSKYWWSSGVITHVKGKAYPAPPVTTLTMGSETGFPGKIYSTFVTGTSDRYDFISVGRKLFRRPSDDNTTAWTEVWDSGAASIDGLYQFNNSLFIFGTFGGTTDFYVQEDITEAATWTPTSKSHTISSQNRSQDGSSVGKTFYIRTASESAASGNVIYFSTTPETDAWTGPIVVGPNLGGYANYRLAIVNNFLFVMNDFAIYSIDPDQEVTEVIWQFKNNPNPDNFKHNTPYNSELIFNVRNEVYSYNPISGETFKLGLSNKDGFSVKEIKGLASDQNFLYILAVVSVPDIRSNDSNVLFAAHQKDGEWVFEVLWEDEDDDDYEFEHLTASMDANLPVTRLYWTAYDGVNTTKTYIQEIPHKWDYSDGVEWDTSSELFTSITKSRFPGFSKRQTFIDGNFLNLDANNTIAIAYKTSYEDSYTTISTADDDHLTINYDNVFGHILALRFTFTSDGTTCPVLLDTTSHQRIRFLYLPYITLSIKVSSNTPLRDNNPDQRLVWEVWQDLLTLRSFEGEILYEDFFGNQFPVTIDILSANTTKNDSVEMVELEAVLVITRMDKGA